MSELKHVPVMLRETLKGLCVKSGGLYFDGTLGGAGHSKEILKRYVQDTIDDAVENKEPERIKEIGKAVDWFF